MIANHELQAMYAAVFRSTFDQPGYYFIDLGSDLDSQSFRRLMVGLKSKLSLLCEAGTKKRLHYQNMGRFNHRHSSQLHRDGAEGYSILMLGYEPTNVDSKVYLADLVQWAHCQSISLEQHLAHTQFPQSINRSALDNRFVDQLLPFQKNTYRLLLLNNSDSFGVFHGAEIDGGDENGDRIVNSMILGLSDIDTDETIGPHEVINFMETEVILR